ncbi:hypothetical protein ScPMuIL_003200 [Solemya velum]
MIHHVWKLLLLFENQTVHSLQDMAGYSLVDAVQTKFSDDGVDQFSHIYVPKRANGPSGCLPVPELLALDNCNVVCAGEPKDLDQLCKHVKELDLTANGLTDWKEIFTLLGCIPDLRFLNLTGNCLRDQTLIDGILSVEFPNLRTLILNNTKVSWDAIYKLLKVFPSLIELHLSLNGYISVESSSSQDFQHPALLKLHFNRNRIRQFSELNRLGQIFPCLESFVNIDSDLDTMCSELQVYERFSKLRCLNISNTKLETWEDIDCLRKFPSLTEARVKDIPFLQQIEEKTRRQLIIARLPNIYRLNGSPVREEERIDAERAFIRKYMDLDDKPQRYFELHAVYGQLDPLVNLNFKKESKIKLMVRLMTEGLEHSESVVIDTKWKVKDLKKQLESFCGVPSSKIRLYLKEHFSPHLLEMIYPTKELRTYRMTEEDEIHVYLK